MFSFSILILLKISLTDFVSFKLVIIPLIYILFSDIFLGFFNIFILFEPIFVEFSNLKDLHFPYTFGSIINLYLEFIFFNNNSHNNLHSKTVNFKFSITI